MQWLVEVKVHTVEKMASKIFLKNKNYTFWIKETLKIEPEVSVKPTTTTSDTDIASLYLPLIKYLRVIGFCPFSIRHQKGNEQFVTYDFKWISFQTVYCFVLSVPFAIFSTIIFFYFLWYSYNKDFHEVLRFQGIDIKKEEVPNNISIVSELGTRLVPATFPLFSCVSVIGTLGSLPNFRRLLNRWPIFQKEYRIAFPHIQDPFGGLRRYRNGTFACFPIIGFIATTFIFVIVYDCNGWAGCIFPNVGSPTFSATFTMLIMIGGHGKHFLMFRTLREAFYQIYVGIREETIHNSISENIESLHGEILKWTQVIATAKKQAKLTSRAVAWHHVFTIFINFVYFCLGVFASISTKLGNADGNRGAVLLLFSCWGFSNLALKAFMCDKITEQETLIINHLRKLQLEANDHIPSLIQINNLIDFIAREPAQIRFWNMVTLNKQFLLQLFGQVATYLIVLIQFDNMG